MNNNQIDELKVSVSNLVQGDVRNQAVIELATKFDINLSPIKEFVQQKRVVLRQLLKHILREEENEAEIIKFSNLLNETESWLSLPKETGYECIFTGCLFRGPKHRDYIRHVTTEHFTSRSFTCYFNHKCYQRFKDINSLRVHVNTHRKFTESDGSSSSPAPGGETQRGTTGPDLLQPCKCPMKSCGGKHFPSIKKLMQHINSDHCMETRTCIFKNCDKRMGPQFVSRKHFYNHHTKVNKTELKDEALIDTSTFQIDNSSLVLVENEQDSEYIEEMAVDEVTEDREVSGEVEDQAPDITKMLANFFNELMNIKMVPATTCQFIITEFKIISNFNKQLQKKNIKKVLVSHNAPDVMIEAVLKEQDNDEFLKAQHQLDTIHKREKYIIDELKVVLPREIILNGNDVKLGAKKESYMYVPIKETVRALMEDNSVIKLLDEVNNQPRPNIPILQDIKDGANFKAMDYFQRNPTALCGIIYSDAIEVNNPLGAARGRNKLVEMYFTLADFPKEFRSQVDRISLVIVVKEKILKKYGYYKVYQPLIKDLIELENEGVLVSKPFERKIKMGVLLHIGDNLEQHSLGGWRVCFSSGRICRICKVNHHEIQNCIHEDMEFWTEEDYNKVVDRIDPLPLPPVNIGNLSLHLFDEIEEPGTVIRTAPEDDESLSDAEESDDSGDESEIEEGYEGEEEDLVQSSGIRARCPFNVLSTFHSTYSLPVDLMHDYCEGVIAEDLLSCIKILISKKYFNESDYNRVLMKIKYGRYDRPEEISLKAKRLKGKAFSNLSHLRYFGLVVRMLDVDKNMLEEPSFKLASLLMTITEMLLAPKIQEWEVFDLKDLLTDYLELREDIYKTNINLMSKMKPKHHYTIHYWRSILMFGPLVSYWTARFESKNRVAKMMANSAKNFVNISKTVCLRQQYRQASIHYRGMMANRLVLPMKTKTKWDLVGENSPLIQAILGCLDEDSTISDEVEVAGVKYKKEDVVILKVHNIDFVEVGVIMAVIIKNGVHFVVNQYRAVRHPELRFFETLNHDENLKIIRVEDIADYKPLLMHGVFEKFLFVLHHHLTVI